jgi:SAM-dependent methyltransferase
VLEALSGSGHATEYLLTKKKALVTGLDISEEAIASFKTRWPGSQAICSSVTTSGLPDESFDCIAVVMGLHHLHPHLPEALRETPVAFSVLPNRTRSQPSAGCARFGTATIRCLPTTKRRSMSKN